MATTRRQEIYTALSEQNLVVNHKEIDTWLDIAESYEWPKEKSKTDCYILHALIQVIDRYPSLFLLTEKLYDMFMIAKPVKNTYVGCIVTRLEFYYLMIDTGYADIVFYPDWNVSVRLGVINEIDKRLSVGEKTNTKEYYIQCYLITT